MGVDSAAHAGALQGVGKTVAVLGCGINFPYLMQNEALRNEIQKTAHISGIRPTRLLPIELPTRNRDIGMQGTVIIQAGDKSVRL